MAARGWWADLPKELTFFFFLDYFPAGLVLWSSSLR